jgi:hypothetical protein
MQNQPCIWNPNMYLKPTDLTSALTLAMQSPSKAGGTSSDSTSLLSLACLTFVINAKIALQERLTIWGKHLRVGQINHAYDLGSPGAPTVSYSQQDET